MSKLIITNSTFDLFHESDGCVTLNKGEAMIFESQKEAESKSIELQLLGSPIHIITNL